MPLGGVLVLSVFSGLVDILIQIFTREVAMRIAFGALMVGGFTLLAASVAAAMALLTATLPVGLADVFLFVFPGNVNACLAVVVTTEAACAGYHAYLLGFGRA